MKRIVCAEDVEKLVCDNQTTLYIDTNTLLTPAAQDAAALAGVAIVCGEEPACAPESACEEQTLCSGQSVAEGQEITSDIIYAALKALHAKGLLDEFLRDLKQKFTAIECGGGKVVRGKSVTLDPVQTCRNQAITGGQVASQEVTGGKDGKLASGFFKVTQTRFEQTFACETCCHLLEGSLTVIINGEYISVHEGDVMHIPAGADVVWETFETARLFYTRLPEAAAR
ncbi:MAG: cupin domain-containing protein [Desulfovibrionales bacterium]|nr:cupin domain-containing protein [Desulfovibrionales bacterium]